MRGRVCGSRESKGNMVKVFLFRMIFVLLLSGVCCEM